MVEVKVYCRSKGEYRQRKRLSVRVQCGCIPEAGGEGGQGQEGREKPGTAARSTIESRLGNQNGWTIYRSVNSGEKSPTPGIESS